MTTKGLGKLATKSFILFMNSLESNSVNKRVSLLKKPRTQVSVKPKLELSFTLEKVGEAYCNSQT